MATKKFILGIISELVLDFITYDRKNDEELPKGYFIITRKSKKSIEKGKITIDEMVEHFDFCLRTEMK